MPGPRRMPQELKKATISVSLAPDLLRKLDRIAEGAMISRSSYIEAQMRKVVDRLERKAAA